MAQYVADYAIDAARDGGAGGDSQEGYAPNSLIDGITLDDIHPAPFLPLLWTPNNVNAAPLLLAGTIAATQRMINPVRAGTPSTMLLGWNAGIIDGNPCPAGMYAQIPYPLIENVDQVGTNFNDIKFAITETAKQGTGASYVVCIWYNMQNNSEQGCVYRACLTIILGGLFAGKNADGGSYKDQQFWRDWMNIDTGTLVGKAYAASGVNFGYHGTWTDAAQTTAWQNGVYRRQASGCTFYVNPIGNGSQTLTLGGNYKLPTSATYGVFNGGGSFNSITIGDGCGLILFPA
jgi:hypothetical protein